MPSVSPKRRRWLFAGVLTLLGGCAVGPNYHAPKVAVPPAFGEANAVPPEKPGAPTTGETRWWESFKDAELASLVERAIKANLDLQIAVARLQEAETAEQVVLGTALPEIGGSGAIGKGTGSDIVRGRVAPPLAAADNTNGKQITQAIGFDGGWQIDLFGQFRREIEAAKYDAQAAADARNDVTVTVIADVARAYFDLRGFEMRLAALNENVSAARQSLDFVTQRYQHGLTNELDVTLAQRELSTLEAQVGPLTAQLTAARDSIAVLIGEYPETLAKELEQPGMIPALPASVGTGLPVELLRRRPDIQEAERQLAASTARIGVAIGNLFPRVGVSAAVGLQGPGAPGTSTSHTIWGVGPAVGWSLLDFGTLDAVVNIADLRQKEFLLAYKRDILLAVQQVDSAISDYTAAQSSLKSLETALEASQRSVTLASERYDRGLTDYLNVLDAQRQQYQLEDQYAAEQQAAADALVNLYRSLGGGWEQYQALPPIRTPMPVIVAAFERLFDSGVSK